MPAVTVVITPRDRYTGIADCIENLYRCTPEPFKLVVIDADYPPALRREMEAAIKGKANATIVAMGLVIPMEALAAIRDRIDTPYLMHLDNDSDVTPGWLPPLLETAAATNAAIINPLTLERAGVDDGEDLRCHLYTSDIRVVDVAGTPYLIENKHFRRTPHRELPTEVRDTETFEMHGVMFETAALQALDIPHMTIREHIDISMQLQAMGRRQVVDPRSVVEFDNLGTRASLSDLKYFDHRWNAKIMRASSDLFFARWGYLGGAAAPLPDPPSLSLPDGGGEQAGEHLPAPLPAVVGSHQRSGGQVAALLRHAPQRRAGASRSLTQGRVGAKVLAPAPRPAGSAGRHGAGVPRSMHRGTPAE